MTSPLFVKWGLDIAKAPPPVQASLEPIIRFFSYHDAHPVALMLVLMEKFGTEWFDWEPETLKHEILLTFRATSISDHNWQKIQAVRTLMMTTGFWNDWPIFEKVIQALNNNIPRIDVVQRCSIAQLMAGVDIANTIRKEEYSDEIAKYVAACALEDGVTFLPPPLDFAQQKLADPHYRCNVCGKEERDDHDGRCDFCTGRFTHDKPLSTRPNPLVDDKAGTNVTKFLLRDYMPVKARYEQLLHGAKDLSEERTEDVQAAKLMVGHQYLIHRNKLLAEQLEELKKWVSR